LAGRLLTAFTGAGAGRGRDQTRRRGLTKLLDWLQRQPGETWQDRWLASGADAAGFEWAELPLGGEPSPRHRRDELTSGLVLLVAGQVIRPTYRWLVRQRHALMLAEARKAIDPEGFDRLEQHAQDAIGWARSDALNKLTWIVICKGGLVADVTVGDCVELTAALEEHHFRGSAGRPLFYALLKETGILPAAAPLRLRALRIDGRRSIEQIIDKYGIECRPVRDLMVEYFTERAPDLDHTSLRSIARNLCRLFWRDLEIHHPGIDSLHLAPEVARAWKERLSCIRDADGHPIRPRVNFRSELVFVKAFYEDIARWAADEPARWAHWVAPSPVKAAECATKKSRSGVKSRMDQRTRAQLPLLPALLTAVEQQRKAAEELITAAREHPAGALFTVADQQFQRCRPGPSGRVYVIEVATGKKRNLTHEEEAGFWSWATVEVLRATGIRIEEMLELTHYSFVAYTLPTTSEIVPMLQVAPSKTDTERLLLVSPELAEVLTAIIFRVRAGNAALPLVSAYDVFEQTWSAPMPFLFQRATAPRTGRSPAATSANAWPRPHRLLRSPSQVSRWNGAPMTSGESSSPTPCGPGCHRTSPRRSAATLFLIPRWGTPRSTPRTWSPTIGRSSLAAGPNGPAKNTGSSPLPNGTSSWPASSCARSPSGSAAVTTERHVRTKTPVSDVPSSGLTRPRCRAWRRSARTSPTGSRRPGTRAGSARSPRSRPPWPPPRRNWKPCASSPPAVLPSAWACPG